MESGDSKKKGYIVRKTWAIFELQDNQEVILEGYDTEQAAEKRVLELYKEEDAPCVNSSSKSYQGPSKKALKKRQEYQEDKKNHPKKPKDQLQTTLEKEFQRGLESKQATGDFRLGQ